MRFGRIMYIVMISPAFFILLNMVSYLIQLSMLRAFVDYSKTLWLWVPLRKLKVSIYVLASRILQF